METIMKDALDFVSTQLITVSFILIHNVFTKCVQMSEELFYVFNFLNLVSTTIKIIWE